VEEASFFSIAGMVADGNDGLPRRRAEEEWADDE